MAVLVEAISVVMKAEEILPKYPGGWETLKEDCPNDTLCADGQLIRVGFMTPGDAKQFVGDLSSHGITYVEDGEAMDLVIVDQQRGMAVSCEWAEFGRVEIGHDQTRQVGACRMIDSESQTLATPDGWAYEGSLSDKFIYVDSDDVPEHMEFLRREDNVDVYRDKRTGKEVYAGRTDS